MAFFENGGGIIGVPGDLEPGDYTYIVVGAAAWSWPQAVFVPSSRAIDYLIGGDDWSASAPWPMLVVGADSNRVQQALELMYPGAPEVFPAAPTLTTYGSLLMQGQDDDPVTVEVRGFSGNPFMDNGGDGAWFFVGLASPYSEVNLDHATVVVDSTIDASGAPSSALNDAFVHIGDAGGQGNLELRGDSELILRADYGARMSLGGNFGGLTEYGGGHGGCARGAVDCARG